MLFLLMMVGVLFSTQFATHENLLNILRNVTLLGIVSTGVAFITYSKHYIDLSIPSIMAFSGLAALSAQPWGIAASLICGLLAGMSVGLINGYVIGYGRVNPIVWTLAMVFMLDGFLRWMYRGHQIYPDRDTSAGAFFLNLSQYEIGGFFPFPTTVMLILVILGQWCMKRTRFGSQVQLTGASYEAARLSGVDVQKTVLLTFLLSSCTTTIAGLLLTSMNKQGTFDTGLGYEFNAITAVVLGGVNLSGGQGSIFDMLGGVLIIGALLNLMTLAGLDSFTQMVVKGIVFIAVVGATTGFAQKSGRIHA
ncbi:MAG: ABC transporter permease [bacterium]